MKQRKILVSESLLPSHLEFLAVVTEGNSHLDAKHKRKKKAVD